MESDIQIPTGLERFGPSSPHIGHSNHLCDMASKGQVTLEQMKELVRNAKFICNKCGRVAANSGNLCEPVSLD
jgi:hypothetical protein